MFMLFVEWYWYDKHILLQELQIIDRWIVVFVVCNNLLIIRILIYSIL
jgi:hypothetical protein